MRLLWALIAIALAPLLGGCQSVWAPPSTAASTGPYQLDSGDRLRIVVYQQVDLTSTYSVDPAGQITMPLIGTVSARGLTTKALETAIADRLRQGFLRDPSVSVQVETFRPFFILGEVTQPGQYAFVSGMTGEKAVAIASGFTPRARQTEVWITRRGKNEVLRISQPISDPIQPGDTVQIPERWF